MSELKARKFFEAVPTSKEWFYQPGAFVNGYLKYEADKVIAEKDKEIAELKQKLEDVNELIKTARNMLEDAQVYLKSEVDKVIAEKNEEIRRLNHKYWSDKANEAAKMKRLIYGGEIIYLDEYCNEKDWRIMHKVWEDEESKCLKKAEEYR